MNKLRLASLRTRPSAGVVLAALSVPVGAASTYADSSLTPAPTADMPQRHDGSIPGDTNNPGDKKPRPPGTEPAPITPRPTGGRYQALALPRTPGTTGDKMMIVDTLTGDVWQWFDTPALSQYIGRTGLTYMGKLKPGTAPGETITFKRFDAGPQ